MEAGDVYYDYDVVDTANASYSSISKRLLSNLASVASGRHGSNAPTHVKRVHNNRPNFATQTIFSTRDLKANYVGSVEGNNFVFKTRKAKKNESPLKITYYTNGGAINRITFLDTSDDYVLEDCNLHYGTTTITAPTNTVSAGRFALTGSSPSKPLGKFSSMSYRQFSTTKQLRAYAHKSKYFSKNWKAVSVSGNGVMKLRSKKLPLVVKVSGGKATAFSHGKRIGSAYVSD